MIRKGAFLGLSVLAFAVAACSDSAPSDDMSAGGSGSMTPNTSNTTPTSSNGGSTSSSSPMTMDDVDCSQPTPLDGSCFEDFLVGCWDPDLSGTCSTDNGPGTAKWSDGYETRISGAGSGFYMPGSTDPCVEASVTSDFSTVEYTRSGSSDTASQTAQVDSDGNFTATCPDGSTFTYTEAEAQRYNLCHGIWCEVPGGTGGGGDINIGAGGAGAIPDAATCEASSDCPSGFTCCSLGGLNICQPNQAMCVGGTPVD